MEIKGFLKHIRKLSREAAQLKGNAAVSAREQFFLSVVKRLVRCSVGPACAEIDLEFVERRLMTGVGKELDSASVVEPEMLCEEPTSLGWAYQVWNELSRDANSWAVSRRAEERNERVDIASVTQLFTDRYIADFLVSRCIDLWSHWVTRQGSCPAICDPAVGTGHILVAAVKKLVARGVPVNAVAQHLYGYDIDPLSVVIARATIFCQLVRLGFSGDYATLSTTLADSLRALDGRYGSLDRESFSGVARQSFDVIVTNPPYLGRRKLPAAFREFLDSEYPAASVDLCAAFLQRCVELLAPDGMLGVVTSDKWMRLRQYTPLRQGGGNFKGLFGELTVEGVYELGERAFVTVGDVHDGMRAAALVGRKAVPVKGHRLAYADLSTIANQSEREAALHSCVADQSSSQYITWLTQAELTRGGDVFLKASGLPSQFTTAVRRVSDSCNVVVGVQTSNDARYVRYVWQAPQDRSGWRVHCKGGGYSRWAGLNRWVIHWQAGADCFLGASVARERAEKWAAHDGWVYSWFANGNLGVRRKQSGWTFGRAAAGGIFPHDRRLIALLNSRLASAAARSVGGKIQLPEGIVKAIPAPSDFELVSEEFVSHAVALKERLVSSDLTEALFCPDSMPKLEELLWLEALLLVVEGHLEQQVEHSMGLSLADRKALLDRLGIVSGWYGVSPSLGAHAVLDRVPSSYMEMVRALDKTPSEIAIAPQQGLSLSALERAIGSGQLESLIDARWLLPSSGIVESVSRAFRIHPFDALLGLYNLLGGSTSARVKLYGPHYAKSFVADLLGRMGHRWWSNSDGKGQDGYRVLSFDDVVSLAKVGEQLVHHAEMSGVPLEKWVTTVILDWQEKCFFGHSPLAVEKSSTGVRALRLRTAVEKEARVA